MNLNLDNNNKINKKMDRNEKVNSGKIKNITNNTM